ncbi:MAG: hypothetical protein LUC32_01610 [Clostridiales bacterium]|nr:hypothetical protein [Clostridiales bacterium]
MRKRILPILFTVVIVYCLAFPLRMAESVADGLTLWYHSILPTLLPFCIFSNIIVQTGIYDRALTRLAPLFQVFYPVKSPLIYPLIAGFLFGFPIGSKICADLCHAGKISSREAETVSCISNNFGPAFLYNYLFRKIFSGQLPAAAVYAACYLPPLLIGRFALSRLYSDERVPKKKKDSLFNCRSTAGKKKNEKPTSGSPVSMKILDAGIMDGFSTMVKLAGYIILSALMADMIRSLPLQNDLLQCISVGLIEITNGINYVSQLSAGLIPKALLTVGIVNLGGISGLMQTHSMMRETGFRLQHYLAFRILCSLAGLLLMGIILRMC